MQRRFATPGDRLAGRLREMRPEHGRESVVPTCAMICFLWLLPGCSQVTLQEASAPSVACEASDIKVNHVEGGKGQDAPLSWEATCGDRRYLCSRIHQRTICDDIPEGFQFERGDG